MRAIDAGSPSRSGFAIRAATSDEAPALIALYDWLFAPPGEVPADWDPARAEVALRQAADSSDSVVLVAEDDISDALIGICSCYRDLHSVRFGHRVWIEDLAVDPQRRSQGIGAALLGAAKAWARERGAAHLELDSSLARTEAHRFYEREGSQYRSFSFGWRL